MKDYSNSLIDQVVTETLILEHNRTHDFFTLTRREYTNGNGFLCRSSLIKIVPEKFSNQVNALAFAEMLEKLAGNIKEEVAYNIRSKKDTV